MTRNEFDSQMLRLRDVYGDSRYPQERVEMFWERFEGLPFPAFSAEVSKLIANMAVAPMYHDFYPGLKPLIETAREEKHRKILASEPDCYACRNLGMVYAKDISMPDYICDYAFRCDCKRGELFFPNHARRPKSLNTADIAHDKFLDEKSKIAFMKFLDGGKRLFKSV